MKAADVEALFWVAACAGLVALLVLVGRTCRPPLRYLLYAQAGYWALSYLARPLFLLAVEPRPRAHDALADFRLVMGGYEPGVAQVSMIVAVGLLSYLLAVTVPARRVRDAIGPRWRTTWRFAAASYGVGWGCRIAMAFGAVNPLTSTLSAAAPVAVGLVLLAVDWTGIADRSRRWAIACCGAGELLYSVIYESKTPVLTFALFFFIAYAGTLRGSRTVTFTVLGGTAAFAAFTMLQTLKSAPGARRDLAVVDRAYPLATRPLLPVLRRFDLYSAVTDASFVPDGRWLSLTAFGRRLVRGFVPWLSGDPFVSSGVRWAREVRAYTIPLNGSTVSLADGVVAEGFAVAGWLGVAVEAVVLAVATVLVARALLSPRPFVLVLGLAVLTRPALFERGVLGLAETLGEALQISAVIAVAWLLWDHAARARWRHPAPALAGEMR